MRVGILTLHYGYNYGGVLQCYALQSFIKSLGHEVEVINYIPSHRSSLISKVIGKLKTIRSFSDFTHNLLDFYKVKKNSNNTNPIYLQRFITIFDEFRKNRIKLSENVNDETISNLATRYDIVIVGSDQVWTNLYSKYHRYFFDWIPTQSNCKRISYAACSAHSFVSGKTKAEIGDLLSRMSAIGVRDLTTKDLVRTTDDRLQPIIVADPTLLHSFDEFTSEIKDPEPYILTYILGTEISGGHEEALKLIKQKYGNLKIISIVIPKSTSNIESHSDQVITDATPETWVSLIRNASFVYTDSFHGIMFSLKFNRPFFAYYANAVRSSRLIDLKTRFRTLPIFNSIPKELHDDYNWDIAEFVNNSKDFITSNLTLSRNT